MEWVLASFHSFFSFSGKEGFVWRLLDKVVSHYGQIDTDWGFIIVQYLGHLKFYSRTISPISNQSSVQPSQLLRPE